MLLVLPFGTFFLQCASDNEDNGGNTTTTNPTQPTDSTPPDAPPRVEGANVVYTSSQTNAHSHSFTVPANVFGSPPAGGLSGATTSAQLHSHLLTISQAQFQSANSGQTVKIETNNVAGHTHTFTLVKVT